MRLSSAWMLVLAMALVDAVWIAAAGWTIRASIVGLVAAMVAVLLAPLLTARYGRDPRTRAALGGAALLLSYWTSAAILSYLAISTNAPLVDAALHRADAALGFDWAAWNAAIERRPLLAIVLKYAYASGIYQMLAVVLLLGRVDRVDEYLRLMILAVVATIALSALFPAAGPWVNHSPSALFDPAVLSHFGPLRDGSMRALPLGEMQGLVSIPSMHAATAVLLVWAARGTFLFAPFVVLNVLMLVATPTFGGHYLVDVIAGIALAVAVVAADRRLSQRRARLRDDRTLAPPIATLGGLSTSPSR